jgi:DNA-binding transcriptional regulator YdaS (Cro superfamily)
MELKEFLRQLPDDLSREAFAKACGTSLGHMKNTFYVAGKALAPAVCVRVERMSEGKVRRWELRTLDWALIWPELIDAPGAPRTKALPAHPRAHQ